MKKLHIKVSNQREYFAAIEHLVSLGYTNDYDDNPTPLGYSSEEAIYTEYVGGDVSNDSGFWGMNGVFHLQSEFIKDSEEIFTLIPIEENPFPKFMMCWDDGPGGKYKEYVIGKMGGLYVTNRDELGDDWEIRLLDQEGDIKFYKNAEDIAVIDVEAIEEKLAEYNNKLHQSRLKVNNYKAGIKRLQNKLGSLS